MPRINGQNVSVFKKLNVTGNLYVGGKLYTKSGSTAIGNQNFTNLTDVAVDKAYFQGEEIVSTGSDIPSDFSGTRLGAINLTENLAIGGQIVENPLVYEQNRVVFDSSGSDYLINNSVSESDTTDWTISYWHNPINNSSSGDQFIFVVRDGGGTILEVKQDANTQLQVIQKDSTANGGGIQFSETSAASTYDNGTLSHILISYDGANLTAYINDSQVISTAAAGSLDLGDATQFNIAAAFNLSASLAAAGDFGDIWFTDEYIDISVESNRRKFIDGNGDPVDLGEDGTNPTGNAPLVYFGDGQTATNWNAGTNLGTSGNFTMNGSVTDA